MNASLSLSSITRPVGEFFEKYHPVIFFTCICLLLGAGILSLYLSSAPPTVSISANQTMISSTFDQATAQKVQQLRQSTDPTINLTLPSPRENPFVDK